MTIEANAWNRNNSSWREMVDSATVAIDVTEQGKVKFGIVPESLTSAHIAPGSISTVPTFGRRNIADISGGDTIIGTDQAKLVNIASGTGTLAFTAVATLAAGFWCVIKNAGTGNVTLNPDGAELIDGLSTWILYPGGSILVECDGTALYSVLLSPMQVTFNSSDTFTKPGCGTWAEVEAWGAGGSGGRAAAAAQAGGGGGGYNTCKLLLSAIGTTETVTIGAGGAARSTSQDGATGGDTTFGSLLSAFGGGGGDNAGNGGGGGGGQLSAGAIPGGAGGGAPGRPLFAGGTATIDLFMGQGGDASVGKEAFFHGGGGGDGNAAGGASVFGGGGGGGCSTTAAAAGGVSSFGGNGGAAAVNGADATAGAQPGGGGGAAEAVSTGISGAGGDGRVIVRVY